MKRPQSFFGFCDYCHLIGTKTHTPLLGGIEIPFPEFLALFRRAT